MGGQIGGQIGALAGQALIPIPGLGGIIGSMGGQAIGSILGGIFGDKDYNSYPQTVDYARGYAYGGKVKKNNSSYARGGRIRRLTGGASEFVGRKHEEGGIDLPGNIEVEGGETMDNLSYGGGKVFKKGGIPYVFSDRLKIPGKNISFAKAHKKLLNSPDSERSIMELARLQEKVSGRDSSNRSGRINKMQLGGIFGGYPGAGSVPPGSIGEEDLISLTPLSPRISGLGELFTTEEGNFEPPLRPAGTMKGKTLEDTSFMDKALPYLAHLPNLLDTATGLIRGKRNIRSTQINRRSESTAASLPVNYDIGPALEEGRRQTLAVQRSPGATTNSRLAAHTANLRFNRQLFADKSNTESDRRFRRDQLLAGIQSENAIRQAYLDENAREQRLNEPGRLDYLSAGLTNAIRTIIAQKEQGDLKNMDEAGLITLIGGYDPVTQERIFKLLEARGINLRGKMNNKTSSLVGPPR